MQHQDASCCKQNGVMHFCSKICCPVQERKHILDNAPHLSCPLPIMTVSALVHLPRAASLHCLMYRKPLGSAVPASHRLTLAHLPQPLKLG